ncbi:MAG: 16S rRNA (guanine(527)-N(7))-methyltransferase RsmG [Paracoccaceae bacterium]|nr:16S rRNA (guanine(527)-N(7))-methyltransferase RsmG [Paracoccaceae bacterium]
MVIMNNAPMVQSHHCKDTFLLDKLGVSRETCEKLHYYYCILSEWNTKVNLVSRKSIESSWQRHFLDSSQLWLYAPQNAKTWLDFGSGGGFPGLVISIIAQELNPQLKVILVEKNKKKAFFLEQVSLKLSLNVCLFCSKVEDVKPQKADVISARAFGALRRLIEIAYMHKNDKTISLFPKGKTFSLEIKESLVYWEFEMRQISNLLSLDSSILEIRNIKVAQ